MEPCGWTANAAAPFWVGLDVGGANLKVADGRGGAWSQSFALWKQPQMLSTALGSMLEAADLQPVAGIGLTMTGELADCFQTKAQGVQAIVEATLQAVSNTPVRIATVDDQWLTPAEAIGEPQRVAAANWRLAARLVAKNRITGLWIDVGSTTVDLISVRDGRVESHATDDSGRLITGELIYTGVRRTPLCAVVRALPYRGKMCPVAAELFATTGDIWLLLGEIGEDHANGDTADGRPFTRQAAFDRIARMVCGDRDSFTEHDARLAAEHVAAAQVEQIAQSLRRIEPPSSVVLTGEGEFLACRVLERLGWRSDVASATELVGAEAARAFPAHAAAVLAAQELS